MLDLVGRLVDKSLVVMEERLGRARYHLLEPVRQYAWEQLLGAGPRALRQRGSDILPGTSDWQKTRTRFFPGRRNIRA